MGKRIGIVGTGFIAMKHLAAFKAQKKAEIVGMCTYSNMEKLRAICEEHQIIPFASMDEMLEKGELDVDGRIDSIVYSQNSTAGKKGEPLINRLFR